MEREREGGKKSDRESSIIKRYKVSAIWIPPTFQHHKTHRCKMFSNHVQNTWKYLNKAEFIPGIRQIHSRNASGFLFVCLFFFALKNISICRIYSVNRIEEKSNLNQCRVLVWWYTPITSAFGEWRQEDQEFKDIFGYKANFSPALITWNPWNKTITIKVKKTIW